MEKKNLHLNPDYYDSNNQDKNENFNIDFYQNFFH